MQNFQLGRLWKSIQCSLFPELEDMVGELSQKDRNLIQTSQFQKSSPTDLRGRNESLCNDTKCLISIICGILHNLGLRRNKPAGGLLKLAQ